MSRSEYKINSVELVELHLSLLEFFLRFMLEKEHIQDKNLIKRLENVQNQIFELLLDLEGRV